MKIKRLFCALFIVAVILGATNLGSITAKAATPDEADLCLLDAIELMVDENVESLSYSRLELFNYELNPLGYGYEIHINGKTGFALMIRRTYYYEVTELYPSKHLPYENISGVPVYLTPLCYIEYLDGEFRDIDNGYILDEEQLTFLNEKGFGYQEDGYEGTGEPGQIVKETVSYDSRIPDEGRIPGAVPSYFDTNPALTGTCAVQAGAVVAGYYARWFPNLIPGYAVGMDLGGAFVYFGHGSTGHVQLVINELYGRMKTNQGGAGTTAAGFRDGLMEYAQTKGRNLTYTSIASGGTLNYDLFKTQVANLKPSVLFFNTYNAIKPPAVRTNGNIDSLEKSIYPGMHVMIGYGYKKYTYYKNGTNFRTDYYIEAYTGVPDCAQGFIKLYDYSILVEGYAINIY